MLRAFRIPGNVSVMAPLRVPTSSGTVSSTRLTVPGATVTLARFPASLRLPPHVHERACLTVLLDGIMTERVRGRERYCERASVLIKPALERHDDAFGRNGSLQIIVEPIDLDSDLFGPFKRLFATEQFQSDGTAERLARRLAGEIEHADAFSSLACSALTHELVVRAARSVPRHRRGLPVPPAWLRRTRELLEECLRAPTLTELAREADVHPAHLARAFRAHYGCSVGSFVRRIRLEAAARDLGAPGVTIAGVAAAHGFSDQSHFTRQFRRHMGVTPREYQMRLQPRD
jgi:AraC family transcriptional regulator